MDIWIWDSPQSFLSLTYEWTYQLRLLAIGEFSESHTGLNIGTALRNHVRIGLGWRENCSPRYGKASNIDVSLRGMSLPKHARVAPHTSCNHVSEGLQVMKEETENLMLVVHFKPFKPPTNQIFGKTSKLLWSYRHTGFCITSELDGIRLLECRTKAESNSYFKTTSGEWQHTEDLI